MYLVRHASHSRVHDTLVGRLPGVALSEAGQDEALALAERLSRRRVDAVWTSPVQRARETAEAIAARAGLPVTVDEGLIEIDFGADWMGRRFDELSADPRWTLWNDRRGSATTPAGDDLPQVQERITDALERARSAHPDGGVVFVSHGDVIKAALAGVLGLSLDHHHRFEVGPASVSAGAVEAWGTKVLSINEAAA